MNCLFCNIANGSIPTNIIFEDEAVLAFHDINPQAPTHALVIPKKHIATINDVADTDKDLIGNMVLAAKRVAAKEGLTSDGFRLVFNVNAQGGQTVYHIHLHVIGGRQMTWPPG